MSHLHDELAAAGYTPYSIPSYGPALWVGWLAPDDQPPPDDGYCTVCGCNAAYCGGPTDRSDMDPDTDLCSCYDDELGEPVC